MKLKDEARVVNSKSSVKLKQTTRGITWEVKVVKGEEDIIEDLKKKALEIHNQLNTELNTQGGK